MSSYTINKALILIQFVYREKGKLKILSSNERYGQGQLTVKPLGQAYFALVDKIEPYVLRDYKIAINIFYVHSFVIGNVRLSKNTIRSCQWY